VQRDDQQHARDDGVQPIAKAAISRRGRRSASWPPQREQRQRNELGEPDQPESSGFRWIA